MTALWLAWQVAAAMPLLEQGRFADARPHLEKACAAKETNGCYLLGRTLLALDQYEAAKRTLLPLAATDRDPWRVRDALGSVHEALREPAEAESQFRSAMAENRDRAPEPRYHLGRFLIREGRTHDAIGVLTVLAERFPKYEPGRFALGRAFYSLDRMKEAEAHLAGAPSMDEAKRLLEKIRRLGGK
ncbi:MAG TPA: tetratricopeptide repeat protein [Bryobacteraceae bacterium]|nr:tetratricopeptide repeat protein [Bryobacteraceae bacterium]